MRGGMILPNEINGVTKMTFNNNFLSREDVLAKKIDNDNLYISPAIFGPDSDNELRIAVRKAIIKQFPQYVDKNGKINYMKIIEENTGVETLTIDDPKYKGYKVIINSFYMRILLSKPGYFSNTVSAIWEPIL